MSARPVLLAWDGRGFTAIPSTAPRLARPLALDSWLVVDGRVLAFDRHRLRFADAVADAGGDRADALAAMRAAMRVVPVAGTWWPRIELTDAGITMWVRSASQPEPGARVEVVTTDRDPRTLPHRKGPDLHALDRLIKDWTMYLGRAVEPVLLDGAGHVAEGAYSALLWWRGDVLHVPPVTVPHLPSVTAAAIRELARHDGVDVIEEVASPEALEGAEVWLANARRGIRGVTLWHDGPAVAAPARADAWQARLAGMRTVPLDRPAP